MYLLNYVMLYKQRMHIFDLQNKIHMFFFFMRCKKIRFSLIYITILITHVNMENFVNQLCLISIFSISCITSLYLKISSNEDSFYSQLFSTNINLMT